MAPNLTAQYKSFEDSEAYILNSDFGNEIFFLGLFVNSLVLWILFKPWISNKAEMNRFLTNSYYCNYDADGNDDDWIGIELKYYLSLKKLLGQKKKPIWQNLFCRWKSVGCSLGCEIRRSSFSYIFAFLTALALECLKKKSSLCWQIFKSRLNLLTEFYNK